MKTICVSLIIWSLTVSNLFFQSCVGRKFAQNPMQPAQSWIANRADLFWHDVCNLLLSSIQEKRSKIYNLLSKEKQQLKTQESILSPSEAGQVNATYGKLPIVYVDEGLDAAFPTTLNSPIRISWYQSAQSAIELLTRLSRLEEGFETNQEKTVLNRRLSSFESQTSAWLELNHSFAELLDQIRYLNDWIPKLKEYSSINSYQEEQEHILNLLYSLFDGNSSVEGQDLLHFKPKRMARPYLPSSLKSLTGKTIPIPIATDIKEKHFLREVEGALDTHWNQSTWAKSQKLRFRIQWTFLPKNQAFEKSRISLDQHLKHFPLNKAVMTTGGLTTLVRGQALILGPGQVTPRTLAHEIGHLLGFSDCYFRTLSSQGIYGLAIMEWENPIYPDDLMCDNHVGEPRAEVW